jgi:hypothetical protein
MTFNKPYQNEFNFSGEELRDAGIALSKETADKKQGGWSERTYELFLEYLEIKKGGFLGEDFRGWASKRGNPEPPSLRAYGHVLVRAAKEGLIYKIGYERTSNPKAHKTPSTLWIKK